MPCAFSILAFEFTSSDLDCIHNLMNPLRLTWHPTHFRVSGQIWAQICSAHWFLTIINYFIMKTEIKSRDSSSWSHGMMIPDAISTSCWKSEIPAFQRVGLRHLNSLVNKVLQRGWPTTWKNTRIQGGSCVVISANYNYGEDNQWWKCSPHKNTRAQRDSCVVL